MIRRHTTPLLLACATVATVAAPAHAQTERIAPGVTVAGVDVAGLTESQASFRIKRQLTPPLTQPIPVKTRVRRFRLSAAEISLQVDGPASAARALKAGRAAAGAPVDVRAAVTYERRGLDAFVATVAKTVRREPRNASIRYGVKKQRIRRARVGRALQAGQLTRRLRLALTDPNRAQVTGRTRTIKPSVTTNGLRRNAPTIVTISQHEFKLRLFKRLRKVKVYKVAVGLPAYPTPNGDYSIVNKAVNPVWSVPNSPWAGELQGTTVAGGSAANPLKARWMGIVGGVGIHGTGEVGSIGTRASHGCIRMTVPSVKDLFRRVPVGAKVIIRG